MDRGELKTVTLVKEWGEFLANHPEAELADFCHHYLSENKHLPSASGEILELSTDELRPPTPVSNREPAHHVMSHEAKLASLMGRLIRFVYTYSKKAMQPLNFRSIDDPIYLIALAQMGTPKKSELIHEMLSEFPSGIDIIKRLIGMGLIEEFPDEVDRRSKRLQITAKGISTLQQCFPEMNKVADIAFGTLTNDEQITLIRILNRLDKHHAEYYKELRNASFEEVYERMIAPNNS